MVDGRVAKSEIAERLSWVLGEVPFLCLTPITHEQTEHNSQIDICVNVTANGNPWKLLVEVKSSGEPRIARAAIQQILAIASKNEAQYGVLAAPYIGSETQKICQEFGVGFIDLAGNCRVVFDKIFIERRGFPKPKAERRPLRSLFSPKASRILRVLFGTPKQSWQVQRLAREARVSLGLAAKVKQRLLDLEYAREESLGIQLAEPEKLLRSWADAFASRTRTTVGAYAPGDLPEIEESLRTHCDVNAIQYAFTQFSGAARVAPFTRYARGAVYVELDASILADNLGWKLVETGANFTLPSPFDEGVFYGARMVGQDRVVSDVQLYLDLMESKARGKEAATAILDQKLRTQW